MKKIIMFNFVTADGYFCGPDGEIDWHPVDKQFNDYAVEFINGCDTVLFGRVTYDLFAGFWPDAVNDASLSEEDRVIAKALSEMRKIVVTDRPLETKWQNTESWDDLTAEKIQELKNQDGKDIVIYGSGTIVKQLTDMGLIDEYRIIIAPVVLGAGRSLFEGVEKKQLTLADSRIFASGNILLTYAQQTRD